MVLNEVGEAYLPSSAMFAREGVIVGAQPVAGGLRHNPARGIKGLVLPAFRVIADLSRSLRVLASQPALIQFQSILFIGRLTTGYKIGYTGSKPTFSFPYSLTTLLTLNFFLSLAD
jgi:hypothetical protein